MDQEDRAETYLRRVVRVTGAEQISDQCCFLDVGQTRFYVHDTYVVRVRDVNPTCTQDETCFYLVHEGMPAAEKIATALLQLKNNPALFDGWVAKRAAFKADGHVFSFCHVQG